MEANARRDLLSLTTRIAAAFLGRNAIPAAELPGLLRRIHGALASPATPADIAAADVPRPAVPIRRSVQHDHIVCLEEGEELLMLRRHLRTKHGMTPEQYIERWGLPADYPMVAPDYAAKRSVLAKAIGLGQSGGRRKAR